MLANSNAVFVSIGLEIFCKCKLKIKCFQWEGSPDKPRAFIKGKTLLPGMGVSQANPPGVLSPARSSHHHQLSDLAWPHQTPTTGFYWSKKTRDVPAIFDPTATCYQYSEEASSLLPKAS